MFAYQESFRTYSKSKMSMINKVTWRNPELSDDAQDIIDEVMGK